METISNSTNICCRTGTFCPIGLRTSNHFPAKEEIEKANSEKYGPFIFLDVQSKMFEHVLDPKGLNSFQLSNGKEQQARISLKTICSHYFLPFLFKYLIGAITYNLERHFPFEFKGFNFSKSLNISEVVNLPNFHI